MPKPQGTYLQTQKIAKIGLRARQSKSTLHEHLATTRRAFIRKLDLAAARNVAYLAHEYGTESSDRGDAIRKAFAEIVDQLNDYREKNEEELSVLNTEMRESWFEYRAVTAGQQKITVSNVVDIAMVTITLLMVLEKLLFGKRR